jgi:hypothetical protein
MFSLRRRAAVKTATKILIAVTAMCAFAAPASAYTLTGTLPPNGKPVVIQLQKPIPHNLIKLTLSGPPGPPNSPGVSFPFVLTFCRGSYCPLAIYAPQGQQMIATFDQGTLQNYTITLGQPSKVVVPFTLEVEVIP